MTDHGAGAVSLYAVRGQPKICSTCTWIRCRIRRTGRRSARAARRRKIGRSAWARATSRAPPPRWSPWPTSPNGDVRCCCPPTKKPTMRAASLVSRGQAGIRRSHRRRADHGRSRARASRHPFGAVRFDGQAGHASGEQKPSDSALHQAMRWGAAALRFRRQVSRMSASADSPACASISARIEGGIKANMIAPTAEVRFGFRPLPTDGTRTVAADDSAPGGAACRRSSPRRFAAPRCRRATPRQAETRRLAARDLADELNIPIGNAVDFWTEAALFSAAGYTTLRLRSWRHRAGAHRRRVGRTRPVAALRRNLCAHHRRIIEHGSA